MDKCSKCGDIDLVITYVDESELINSSSFKIIDDEFVSSSDYGMYNKLTAKKEHLYKRCRTCHYEWRENTIDNIKKAELLECDNAKI